MKRVGFRVEGNAQIGLGHVMRCLAVARQLEKAWLISFICRELPEKITDQILAAGFSVTIISSAAAERESLSALDILILDGYEFDESFQHELLALKNLAVISINDYIEKRTITDYIINHSPGISPDKVNCAAYTRCYLGPKYALLHPAFISLAQQIHIKRAKETVLICFGGSDAANLTLTALQIVLGKIGVKKILVVTGASYAFQEKLTAFSRGDERVFLFHSVSSERMSQLFSEADLAIVPASSVLMEAIAAGCEIISGYYVDNQLQMYSGWKELNAFTDAGNFTREGLNAAFDQWLREGKEVFNEPLIDGKSGDRLRKIVILALLESTLNLRKAELADLNLTFAWASDETIRRFSFSRSVIGMEEHSNWFSGKIAQPNCYYYIVEVGPDKLGSVRFDKDEEGNYAISYHIDPAFHGKGYGTVVLKKAIKTLILSLESNSFSIYGLVMKENLPSLAIFRNLSFEETQEDSKIKFTKYVH